MDTKKIPTTEREIAEEFCRVCKNEVKYNLTSKQWYIWDNIRWILDLSSSTTNKKLNSMVDSIRSRVGSLQDHETGLTMQRKLQQYDNYRKKTYVLKEVKSTEGMFCTREDFDVHPNLINLQNGTYDFSRDTLVAHNPKHMLSKALDFEYNPNAGAPNFKRFLNTVMDNNKDMIQFIIKALSMSITGYSDEKSLFFCYGHRGNNGKTTLFRTMHLLLGDYQRQIDSETLMRGLRRSGNQANDDLADLQGARLVVAPEVGKDQVLNERIIKLLTGNDVIRARHSYELKFEFEPSHTIWMYGNTKPVVRGTDDALWNRVKTINFDVDLTEILKPGELKKDHEVMCMFREELPGIFNILARGWKDYKRDGLNPPESVVMATSRYRSNANMLQKFFKETCTIRTDNRISASKLYTHYRTWASSGDMKPVPRPEFYDIVNDSFKLSEGTNTFFGISLKNVN